MIREYTLNVTLSVAEWSTLDHIIVFRALSLLHGLNFFKTDMILGVDAVRLIDHNLVWRLLFPSKCAIEPHLYTAGICLVI